MSDTSRISVYEFAYGMFSSLGVNVYSMEVPQSLDTATDIASGFIVIRVNNIYDNSEFVGNTYATSRVLVEAYIPAKTRGRVDVTKYKALQDKINAVVKEHCEKVNQDYVVSADSILNYDDTLINNTTEFFMYVISFTVTMTE
jgi:hypothetical protein